MINNTLRKELEEYYHESTEKHYVPSKESRDAIQKVNRIVKELNLEWDNFNELEHALANIEETHELQGFIWGYEHCLTMLNLAKES